MSWLDRDIIVGGNVSGINVSGTGFVRQSSGVTNPTAALIQDSDLVGVTKFTAPTVAVTRTVDGASSTINQGYGVMQKNGKVTLASSAALSLSLYIAGIVIASAAANSEASLVTHGPLDPAVFNLGAGVACAVGLDTNGKPVRVTDATCVSGLKYVGTCDVNGAIYVNPTTDHKLDVTSYGVTGDGATDDHDAIVFAIARANAIGCSALFKASPTAYRCVGAITLDNYTRIEGERLLDGTLGTVIVFEGSSGGFVVGGTAGAFIELKRLTVSGDSASNHLFYQPTGQLAENWRIANVVFNIGNKNKGAIVLGASGDSQGVQNSWSQFDQISINAAAQQAVPVIQLYGVSSGLNTIAFNNITMTGGGAASGSNRSVAPFVVVQSTDANIIANVEFNSCGFEIPYAGGIKWLGVRACKMRNCWAGDMAGTPITAPFIFMGASPNTGGLTSKYLMIDTLFSDVGENLTGQATVQLEAAGGQYGLVLVNSLIPSIEAVGNPITMLNSEVLHTVSTSVESWLGTDTLGAMYSNLQGSRESSIILQAGLNSDVGTQDFYSSLIRVVTTSVSAVQLGGLAMGAFGDGTRATIYYRNTNDQKLTVVNEDASSSASNRIRTLTGANVDVGASDGAGTWWAIVDLVWEKNLGRFVLTGARP